MATISTPARSVRQEAQLEGAPVTATLDWGNSAPLALLAFAVTTFILSMTNANAVSAIRQGEVGPLNGTSTICGL